MLPVFPIESSVFGCSIVFVEDSVPGKGEIVVDVDGDGTEVFFYFIKVKAPKHIPSDLFLSVISFRLIKLLNEVTKNPISLSDWLICGIVPSRTIRMMDE